MLEDQTINVLTIEQVMTKLGIGRTMVYKLINEDDFPRQIKVGRCSRWVESEIDTWLHQNTNSCSPSAPPSPKRDAPGERRKFKNGDFREV